VICVPITANTQVAALHDLDQSLRHADVVELRMDLIRGGNLRILMDKCRRHFPSVKILVANRGKENGSIAVEEQRIGLLKEAIELGADFVDVELDVAEHLREDIIRQIRAKSKRTRLIISHHDFTRTPPARNLKEIYHACVLAGADIVKIVTTACCMEDNLKILNLIPYARRKNQDIIAFCMGEKGKISRIMSPLLGALFSFAALERGAESAPGQMTVGEMMRLMDIIGLDCIPGSTRMQNTSEALHFDEGICPATFCRLYALFGNPVRQSLSPLMHNAALKKMNIEGMYVPFCVEDLASAVNGIRGMNIGGVSVTIPFKVSVMEYLDEVDADALKIGAVNTLVNHNSRLKGFNTDWIGLVQSLESVFDIRGKVFAVMGAGGTARAAIFGILKKGGIPVVFNRSVEKGERLANEWGCSFHPLSELGNISADCLINTTPVGMMPDTDKSPVESAILKNFRCVVDVIYHPLETKLLKDAEKAGCVTVSGLDMFIHQGAEQIKLWTGQEPPKRYMKQIVMNALRLPGS